MTLCSAAFAAGHCYQPFVKYGNLTSSDATWAVGAVVEFACRPGYTLEQGSITIECVDAANPQWNETEPACRGPYRQCADFRVLALAVEARRRRALLQPCAAARPASPPAWCCRPTGPKPTTEARTASGGSTWTRTSASCWRSKCRYPEANAAALN